MPPTKTSAAPALSGTAKWLSYAALVAVLAGLGVSAYLVISHYTSSAILACPETGVINCAKVTTSSYSEILGIPVALLGLLYFVALLPLNLPVAWRSRSRWLRLGRLGFTATGIVMIMWLIYVELFKLNAICLYCTAVHVITLILFAITAITTALTSEA